MEFKDKRMEQSNNNHKETDIDITIEDVPYHSDKDMLIHVGVKFLLLFCVILGFDFLLDLMLGILDLFFELIHLLIEIIDETLESLLKDLLPTSHQQNEAIIVNVAMLIALFGIYKLFHGVRFLYRLKRHIKADWLNYKKRKSISWQLLPLVSKIKLVTAYCVGFSLLFLLAF